jgi:serine/threonine protein kinase
VVRAREQAGWVTDTGATVGTAGYVSPEQLVGEGPIDARTDVFALGCVLYECLGGRAAFSSTDLTAALGETLFDEPPSLEHVAPDVPSPVRALVERMLSKDRAGRPPHGAAVAEEIGRLQAEIRERS